MDLALAGLSLQVAAMVVFCGLFGDYLVRYRHDVRHEHPPDGGPRRLARPSVSAPRMRLFLGFMAAATVLILVRCAYRVAELHQGYSGGLVKEEGLFIGLEGGYVYTPCLLSCFCPLLSLSIDMGTKQLLTASFGCRQDGNHCGVCFNDWTSGPGLQGAHGGAVAA